MRVGRLLPIAAILGTACAGGGDEDLGTTGDFAVDAPRLDFSRLPDAAISIDGAVVDFALPDFAVTADGAKLPDLVALPDLVRLPDLTALPDLTPPADLAMALGKLSFAQAKLATTGPHPSLLFAADFNNDQKLDLVVIDATGQTPGLLLGNGDGTLQKEVNLSVPGASALAIADLNHDGNMDILTGNQNGNASDLAVLLGNGNGTFQAAIHSGTTGGMGPCWMAVGDLDRDGQTDVVIAESATQEAVLAYGDGKGNFINAVHQPFGQNPDTVGLADVNSDQRLDLLVGMNGGEVWVMLGGGGQFGQAATYQLVTDAWDPRAVADLNGDGAIDLAVAGGGSGLVALMYGNGGPKGNGTFAVGPTYKTASAAPVALALADFNLDGKLDVASADKGGTTTVFLGGGNPLQAGVSFTSGSIPDAIVSGDFNGDGKPDLALANNLGPNIAVLLNTSN